MIKLFGARLKCAKWQDYVLVHLVASVNSYSKLIVWEIEGREYAAAGGDRTFIVVDVGRRCELLIGVLTFFPL